MVPTEILLLDGKSPNDSTEFLGEIDRDRVETVLSLIVSGASERQIVAVIQKKWPGADAEPLIVAAMASLQDTGSADVSAIHGFCIEATRAIYRKAISDGDGELALKAVNQLHRIAIGK